MKGRLVGKKGGEAAAAVAVVVVGLLCGLPPPPLDHSSPLLSTIYKYAQCSRESARNGRKGGRGKHRENELWAGGRIASTILYTTPGKIDRECACLSS